MCLRRCLLCLALAAAVVVAPVLVFAAKWLPDTAKPESADAIVVLAGDVRRALYAGDLFNQGYAPLILVSRPIRTPRDKVLDSFEIPAPRAEEIDMQILRRKGVPAERIAFFGEASISTYEEALALRKRFAGQSPTLLVVTSPYHTRRAGIVLRRDLPDAKVVMVATAYEEFPERWWASQDAARDLLLELAKLAYYAAGGRFAAAPKPEPT